MSVHSAMQSIQCMITCRACRRLQQGSILIQCKSLGLICIPANMPPKPEDCCPWPPSRLCPRTRAGCQSPPPLQLTHCTSLTPVLQPKQLHWHLCLGHWGFALPCFKKLACTVQAWGPCFALLQDVGLHRTGCSGDGHPAEGGSPGGLAAAGGVTGGTQAAGRRRQGSGGKQSTLNLPLTLHVHHAQQCQSMGCSRCMVYKRSGALTVHATCIIVAVFPY